MQSFLSASLSVWKHRHCRLSADSWLSSSWCGVTGIVCYSYNVRRRAAVMSWEKRAVVKHINLWPLQERRAVTRDDLWPWRWCMTWLGDWVLAQIFCCLRRGLTRSPSGGPSRHRIACGLCVGGLTWLGPSHGQLWLDASDLIPIRTDILDWLLEGRWEQCVTESSMTARESK